MRFVYGDGVAYWVLDRLPSGSGAVLHNAFAIGIMADGKLLGGVMYENYKPLFSSITASVVIEDKRSITRGTLKALFGYPFRELGVNRINCFVDATNKKSRQACEKVGFTFEGRLRQGAAMGHDLLVYGMLREECRWL